MTSNNTHKVFSYGTLRQENVQIALYNRKVKTVEDTLLGWRLDWIQITDPEVIEASGSDSHPILRRSNERDFVSGAYLELTDAELNATDAYEVSDYVRVLVPLESGVHAYVYVAADTEDSSL